MTPAARRLRFGVGEGPRRDRGGTQMAGVRVLVGTRKGAFVLSSDGKRESWDVAGPHFAGWEMYHLKGSPVEPDRIYASQSNGWFGQLIQRSDDGGATWQPVGNQFQYEGVPGTHQWYDGTPHPWEFARVWHLEPSLTDPDTVYAGVEDAALVPLDRRRSTAGRSSQACAATGRGRHGSRVPAACACTRSSSIRANPVGSSSPYPRPACSAATTAARRGARPTTACARAIPYPTRMPRSVTASTTLPGTPPAPRCSTCKSTGT